MANILSLARQAGDDDLLLNLSEFVGQRHVRERVAFAIESAQRRGEPCDHLLLSGPPGTGKHAVASIVAEAMGGEFYEISGPASQRPSDIIRPLLANATANNVFLIDEIHALLPNVEEVLYVAIEDGEVDLISSDKVAQL